MTPLEEAIVTGIMLGCFGVLDPERLAQQAEIDGVMADIATNHERLTQFLTSVPRWTAKARGRSKARRMVVTGVDRDSGQLTIGPAPKKRKRKPPPPPPPASVPSIWGGSGRRLAVGSDEEDE